MTKETKEKAYPNDDPYDFQRFLVAQSNTYETALSEIRSGCKYSHWMWYIFPQFDGLGYSATTRHYAIKSVNEAKAYLAHSILGPRLVACIEAVLQVQGLSAREIFGMTDELKLRSCATLFDQVSPPGLVFERLLDRYFDSEKDDRTLFLIRLAGQVENNGGI